MPRARLIVADDHEILLDGLRSLLQSEFDVVATATNGADVLNLCRTLQPNLVIMDVGMPVLSGMEVAELLAKERTNARIIFLTMQGEAELVVRAFRLGVAGYVMKHAASAELMTAIREVLAGRTYISPRVGRDLVAACLAPPTIAERKPAGVFTDRQIEVVRLIARGLTMKEVAATLRISTRTAEAHKYQMMKRHGIRTVPELIQFAINMKVVDLPAPPPPHIRNSR